MFRKIADFLFLKAIHGIFPSIEKGTLYMPLLKLSHVIWSYGISFCLPQQWMSINNLIRLICLRLLNVKGFVATASALFVNFLNFKGFLKMYSDVFAWMWAMIFKWFLTFVKTCNSYVNFCHFSVFKFNNCQWNLFILLSGPSVNR